MYDCVVIGSGYGGATVAARLAPHSRVLLVERGKWWRPGKFPRGVAGIARSHMGKRNPAGLWAMRLGEGTGNAFASAFGGASAINYGITARPDDHVFDQWPVGASEMAPYFSRALSVLRPEPNPIGDELGDKQFIDLVEPGCRVDIKNTIDWSECGNCGDCVPGCNPGAKRALDRTYLDVAMKAGVELRLETTVRTIRPRDGGYRVHLETTGGGSSESVATRQVVICAGTMGTLDLMHAHRSVFPLSASFGTEMSMNGDGLAFLYNTRHRLSSHSGAPISTSARIPFTDPDGGTRTLMIMSGRVPRSAMRFAGAALSVLSDALADRSAQASPVDATRLARRLRDLAGVGAAGALSHSFMFKLDSQDSNRGHARFTRDGKAVLDWPDYADDPINQFAAERLKRWAAKVGGTVVPNVAKLPGMRSFSVHPLGGCRMGADVGSGVVDDVGRVFRPDGGVYPGLRIIDASIIPTSVGVPPSLTVAAVAERAAEHMLATMGNHATERG